MLSAALLYFAIGMIRVHQKKARLQLWVPSDLDISVSFPYFSIHGFLCLLEQTLRSSQDTPGLVFFKSPFQVLGRRLWTGTSTTTCEWLPQFSKDPTGFSQSVWRTCLTTCVKAFSHFAVSTSVSHIILLCQNDSVENIGTVVNYLHE